MAKKRGQPRNKLGQFVKRKAAGSRAGPRRKDASKKSAGGPSIPAARGLLGLKTINLPDDISPTFRRYTKPVSPNQKRLVYAFVEVDRFSGGLSTFDFLTGTETFVHPVIIGRYTRRQLAKLTRAQLAELLSLTLPGTQIRRIAGFGHALTRTERRGIKFTRAQKRNRKTRKSGHPRRHKSAKRKSKKRGSRNRV